MTKLRPGTPLTRETDVFERTDALVVSLEPRRLTIRLKGRREAHSVDYGTILDYLRKRDYQRGVAKERDYQRREAKGA